MDFIRLRRAEQLLRGRARCQNLPGDPIAHVPQVAARFDQQLASVGLYLSLPPQLRSRESWEMSRAAAYGDRTR